MVKRWELFVMVVGSLALFLGAWTKTLPLGMTETLGFVTGAVGVWLTVKENIWNWPIGIANSAFFVALFFSAHLFADMALQIIYIILGFLGWYWWLRGGANQTTLHVSHASRATLLILAAIGISATGGLTVFLRSIGDAAPFLDALTTVLSLAAQYLLTRKLIENWYIWITADIIYIGLYGSRGLYLTAALYVLFLGLCLLGLRSWRGSLAPQQNAAQRLAVAVEGVR
ncbi:MAG TPA: nicotinamide riboside transporter PnuC [Thermomicrobiales bacterium]|jgi:nicotinamide mononucleotide transporter